MSTAVMPSPPSPASTERRKNPGIKALLQQSSAVVESLLVRYGRQHSKENSEVCAAVSRVQSDLPVICKEVATVRDELIASLNALPDRVVEAVTQRRNERHLDKLIRTLIGLREDQRMYPQMKCLEVRANDLSIQLENDCDLAELEPKHLDEFDPALHHQVAESETSDPNKVGKIKKCLRIGITWRGKRFKNYFADVARFVAVKRPNKQQ